MNEWINLVVAQSTSSLLFLGNNTYFQVLQKIHWKKLAEIPHFLLWLQPVIVEWELGRLQDIIYVGWITLHLQSFWESVDENT